MRQIHGRFGSILTHRRILSISNRSGEELDNHKKKKPRTDENLIKCFVDEFKQVFYHIHNNSSLQEPLKMKSNLSLIYLIWKLKINFLRNMMRAIDEKQTLSSELKFMFFGIKCCAINSQNDSDREKLPTSRIFIIISHNSIIVQEEKSIINYLISFI